MPRIDAVVGNPPYNNGNNKSQIADLYLYISTKLSNKYVSMVVPGSFLLKQDSRSKYLRTLKYRNITTFSDSKKVFETIDVTSSIVYFLLDRDYTGPTIIDDEKEDLLSLPVFPIKKEHRKIFRKVLKNNPNFDYRLHDFVDSSICPPETNYDQFLKSDDPNAIPCHFNKNIGIKYVDRRIVNEIILDKYKVCIGSGDGAIRDWREKFKVVGRRFIIPPGEYSSHAYYLIFSSKSKKECENYLTYFEHPLVQFMIGIQLPTFTLSRSTLKHIPCPSAWDKSWTYDEVYKAFNIDQDMIDIIESRISFKEIS